jgi:hypothetical protein
MNLLKRLIVKWFDRLNHSIIQPFNVLLFTFVFTVSAFGQFSLPEEKMARSASGQFFAIAPDAPSRISRSQSVFTNTDLIRLDPALLTVSAERIKQSLGRQLDMRSDWPWRGKIYLVVHPAQSSDDDITIVSKQSGGNWSYQMQLPDVVSQSRFLRAMTGVLLQENANRDNASSHAAEVPAWLTDGLSQQIKAENISQMILSPPQQIENGLPMTRTDRTKHGLDSFAKAREILRNYSALTFDQLSWPTSAQLIGDDDDVYHSSAQLFVHELLALPNGSGKLRAMLEQLPQHYNWQTAFKNVFAENFPNTLAVEKWWALQVISFVAQEPGSRWTPMVSRDKLDEILRVPVAVRAQSNALPTRAEVSLQVIIRNFEMEKQTAILQTKLRDLQLAQFRMAASLSALTDNYRIAIANYLGEGKGTTATTANKHAKPPRKSTVEEALKRLDDLDAQRRDIAAAIPPDKSFQPRIEPKFQLNAAQ